MKLSRDYTMRDFVEMDGGAYWLTEKVLNDPSLYRRLVRTQIEELKALYRHYPLSEFDEVGHILNRLQQAYSDVEPFDHPLLAALTMMRLKPRQSPTSKVPAISRRRVSGCTPAA